MALSEYLLVSVGIKYASLAVSALTVSDVNVGGKSIKIISKRSTRGLIAFLRIDSLPNNFPAIYNET